ncbi:hypothetical protein Pan216_13910 [Planctomycetes bacterium Pan216]|uniref:Type II toxin-antitoxin system ParD family antitoxin n=1 Tax=Kolteria novifilia TaxID=2527975 RepID=A0A518B0N1_9BACT|nr:hypothetical protein Pan216_13910 [Planctomycetes bacterium Pan216]
MQIEISPHVEQKIKELIARGAYASPEEAVEAGIESLPYPEPTMESFVAKIKEAQADVDAGRVDELDMEGIREELRRRIAQQDAS